MPLSGATVALVIGVAKIIEYVKDIRFKISRNAGYGANCQLANGIPHMAAEQKYLVQALKTNTRQIPAEQKDLVQALNKGI